MRRVAKLELKVETGKKGIGSSVTVDIFAGRDVT